MTESEQTQWEAQAYGTTVAELEAMLTRSAFDGRRPAEVNFAVSVMSDVQELVARMGAANPAMAEEARQCLNRAKFALLRLT